MEQVFQDELVKVSDWMTVNGFKLNIGKSVCMLIGTQQRAGGKSLCLSLNERVLKQVSSPRIVYKSSFNLAKSCRLHFKRMKVNIYSINRLKPPLAVRSYCTKLISCPF